MLIAFDLDGVLYTSEPFLADAYREAIEVANQRRPGSFQRVPTSEEIFRHIGWPVPTILARLFPDSGPREVALIFEVTLEVICRRVRRREGRLFDGVADTLAALGAGGHELVVASNGRRPYVEAVLSSHDLTPLFEPLLAVEAGLYGDKIDLLRAYVARYRRTPEATVMVGDRASDVEAAEAVGTRFIGCDYGHGHRDEIADRGPIVGAFAELPRVVAAMADETR
jgi:phosphoglycolate phosphatase